MNSRKTLRIIVIFAFVFLICGLFFWIYNSIFGVSQEEILSYFRAYEYNPKSIIQDIHNKKENILIETEASLYVNLLPGDSEIIKFSDQDFYDISQFVMKNVNDEYPGEWHFLNMNYKIYDCPEKFSGDTILASFKYIKPLENVTENQKNYRDIQIASYGDTILLFESVIKDEWSGNEIIWDNVNYSSRDITKMISETEIYRENHKKTENCGFFIISLSANDQFWQVKYVDGHGEETMFEATVNTKTGEIIEEE